MLSALSSFFVLDLVLLLFVRFILRFLLSICSLPGLICGCEVLVRIGGPVDMTEFDC